MKFLLLWSCVLLIKFQVICQTDDVHMLKNDFGQLKTAVLSSDYNTALRYIDKQSEKYFDDLSNLVVTADSITIRRINLVERLHVLIIRQMCTTAELQSIQSGNGLLIYAIKSGIILKNTMMMVEPEAIHFAGNEATASVRGSDSSNSLKFTKEEGVWKLSIPSLFVNAATGLRLFMLSNDWTEDEFIHRSLRNISGREPRPGIWSAMR